MEPRRSGSDGLLDGERSGEPTIAHTNRRDRRECLLLSFRGNCSNLLSNESHHAVCKRRPIECAFNSVAHALWKVSCSYDRLDTGHAHRFGRVN
jgi:hypothetical protein